VDSLVACDDREALGYSLRDQHSVERIAMNERERIGGVGM
jgi:hypothetical protein